jgi:hypothetical protein
MPIAHCKRFAPLQKFGTRQKVRIEAVSLHTRLAEAKLAEAICAAGESRLAAWLRTERELPRKDQNRLATHRAALVQ